MMIPSHFMIQSRQQVWSSAEVTNLARTSLAWWAAVFGFANAQPSTDQARCLALTDHQPNWIQTKLATKQEVKPVAY